MSTLAGFASSEGLLALERENHIPVQFHVHDGPAPGLRLVERLVEFPDARLAVVGPFAHGVRVMDKTPEAGTLARGRPLQHLQITLGNAQAENRPATDILGDVDPLARALYD